MKSKRYKVLHPRTFDTDSLLREAFALDVLMGLSSEHKSLPSKYFYDDAGSALFSQIMDLPEYYPTSCERLILEARCWDIAEAVANEPFRLVELGAGDGRKTRLLLDSFLQAKLDFDYVPVDISEAAMRDLTKRLSGELPALRCSGLVAEYFDGLRWLARESGTRMLVLFLGSNIGNFTGPGQRVFLRTLWSALDDGDLVLTGFDLKKDIDVLLAAYNDGQGVTKRFNLNLLQRINAELGGRFNLNDFRHFGTYNVFSGAMESYLISLHDQEVFIGALNRSFRFRAWEPIHVEYSFKFLPSDIPRLAEETGFEAVGTYGDPASYFIDALWRVRKESRQRDGRRALTHS